MRNTSRGTPIKNSTEHLSHDIFPLKKGGISLRSQHAYYTASLSGLIKTRQNIFLMSGMHLGDIKRGECAPICIMVTLKVIPPGLIKMLITVSIVADVFIYDDMNSKNPHL